MKQLVARTQGPWYIDVFGRRGLLQTGSSLSPGLDAYGQLEDIRCVLGVNIPN